MWHLKAKMNRYLPDKPKRLKRIHEWSDSEAGKNADFFQDNQQENVEGVSVSETRASDQHSGASGSQQSATPSVDIFNYIDIGKGMKLGSTTDDTKYV
ncbi:hypothetical protein LSAT2_022676, partial [Lamellibrachia satsuma]